MHSEIGNISASVDPKFDMVLTASPPVTDHLSEGALGMPGDWPIIANYHCYIHVYVKVL